MPRKNPTPNPGPSNVVQLTTVGEWLTVDDVCELLRTPDGPLSRKTLDKWRARAVAPFPAPRRLPNRSVRFLRADVAAWLDALPLAA
ncbi:helix-turn-helix transcriptional regulator [Blastococcus mobilis]|uniref:Helix-turn-helix domain-containing protein n=1 Tax=Blastococcus mobilis TaxID=1938746 RepID=A0A238VXQ1_9ACTN|nr:helix-turn-helix domain-containing protein [Blastococcus mobilis]SNR39080.1 Helix-turn-helix domain-containing protein [Blastococcus mobilis]